MELSINTLICLDLPRVVSNSMYRSPATVVGPDPPNTPHASHFTFYKSPVAVVGPDPPHASHPTLYVKHVSSMNAFETKRLAETTMRLCVSERMLAMTTFKDLVTVLRDDTVLKLMTFFIKRVCFLSSRGVVNFPAGEIPVTVIKPRTFLAAYLIKYHPKMVFEYHPDTQCGLQQELKDTASNMLVVFEGIRQELISQTKDDEEASANMLAFPLVTTRYIKALEAWMVWDMAHVIQ